MIRNYVGLACSFHDPALAIVDQSGEVVFAEGAERALQDKRAMNAPPDPIHRIRELIEEYCDPRAELVVAKSWSGRSLPQRQAAYHLVRFAESPPELYFGVPMRGAKTSTERFLLGSLAMYADANFNAMEQAGVNLEYRMRELGGDWATRLVHRNFDHHLTHAAAACFSSPFTEAVCAVLDGWGEHGSVAYYTYREGRLIPLDAPIGDGSLGLFYAYLCQACGFDYLKGEEWKVMGLASYGKRDEKLHSFLRSLIEYDELALSVPTDYSEKLHQLFEIAREPDEPALAAADLARTGQEVFEEVSALLLHDLASMGISKNLVLSGGCALNSSWNGKLLEQGDFDQLYVFPAPADDGNCVGAALLAHRADHPFHKAPVRVQSPYLGTPIDKKSLDLIEKYGRFQNVLPVEREIHEQTAELLAEGKIVGWMQGRAEFGPRALGNRSILADPRPADMKDRINATVKFREEFRPFAPSILHEHGAEWFEDYRESPYMERTLVFRPEVRARVPAVVHRDGTGRLQTVKREWNPRFHDLIRAFYELTGIPILLNTSFNVMGKPIIHSVEDAVVVFLTSGLDALVIDDRLYLK
jgi:carbamoyltransferase